MLRNFASVFLFTAVSILTVFVWDAEQDTRELKADYVELRHIKYGLFNVDEWKNTMADIIREKVENFVLTPENKEEVQKKVEDILEVLIDEIEETIREKNSEDLSGLVKQLFIDAMVNMSDIKEGIPEYAKMIVDQLNDPDTRINLKDFLVGQMEVFADETVGRMDYTYLNHVIDKYEVESRSEAILKVEDLLDQQTQHNTSFHIALALVVLLLIAAVLIPGGKQLDLIFAMLSAIVLLIGGIGLPMIDIEATIAQFSFEIVGVPLSFNGQVLFFQSKSIFEVVKILIMQGDLGMVLVAILATAFSIVIPVLKLLLSFVVVIRKKAPANKLMSFLVFKAGKWSMADVLVVAMFMAFIGFTGVINSQLTQIEENSGSLEVITTNNSTLMAGFYLFLGYTLLGLCLSHSLDRKLQNRTHRPQLEE